MMKTQLSATTRSPRPLQTRLALALVTVVLAPSAWAAPVFSIFESAGATPASITATRDAFRTNVGGGSVAGANGSFGGVRREINWDGVPAAKSDPNALPANFFNTTSPRGAVFSTPGSGFAVSANAGGATPVLFGLGSDFQAFSPQKIFTAIGSTITDVSFFLPGTTKRATTNAFAAIFTDVEVAGSTHLDFFDINDVLIFSRDVLVGGNQSLSFLGASGGAIGRVRIQSGNNPILGSDLLGNTTGDVVAMDDFLFAEPTLAVPEPSSAALLGVCMLGAFVAKRRKRDMA